MKAIRFISLALFFTTFAVCPLAGCSADSSVTSTGTATPTQETFSHSQGLDDNGYWAGVRALDYVEKIEYLGLAIPGDKHQVTDEQVQSEVNSVLSGYLTTSEISGRAAKDGDTLNIDYVGSIDGVKFDGGSTEGAGTDVTIGTTPYIDDFMEQLIGHKTGESFDITVTFPEDYGEETLNGKDAVFAVTINKISETITPKLNDKFVTDNLATNYGWKTVAEMKKGIEENLHNEAVLSYVQEYLSNVTTTADIPETIWTYQEDALILSYESYAESNGVPISEFLTTYVGVASLDELVLNAQEDLRRSAIYSLAVQAIAEDAGITVTDEELASHFLENMGDADYSAYEAEYGLPYLKQAVLGEKTLELIVANAVLE